MFASVIKPIILPKFGSLHKKAMSDEGLTECVRLAEALPGIAVKSSFTVNLRKPDPGQLLGDGKVKQLHTRCSLGIQKLEKHTFAQLFATRSRLQPGLAILQRSLPVGKPA